MRLPPKAHEFIPTPGSAMRGVILTDTGEILATPVAHPVELTRLVLDSPQVKLNFSCIFDKDVDSDDENADLENPLSSPSRRRNLAFSKKKTTSASVLKWPESEDEQDKENLAPHTAIPVPASRLRKPSIRTSTCPAILSSQALENPETKSPELVGESNTGGMGKNKDAKSSGCSRRSSTVSDLRTKAVTNAAMNSARRTSKAAMPDTNSRPLLDRAKQASEGAKKALSRS